MKTDKLWLPFITLFNLTLFYTAVPAANAPDWGTLLSLDQAFTVVAGTMVRTELEKGHGTLVVTEVLKGKPRLMEAEVQFSGLPGPKKFTKQRGKPAQRYVYSEGQEGIWVLMDRGGNARYNLCSQGLYYDLEWIDWVRDRLRNLKDRQWSAPVNGLAASVIVDGAGGNKSYRYFHLCLRNDSQKTLFLNTNHSDVKANRNLMMYNAVLTTPAQKQIDIAGGYKSGGDFGNLSGGPGWRLTKRDFRKVEPGQIIYLPKGGDLRYFAKHQPAGLFRVRVTYKSMNDGSGFKLKDVWTGQVESPVISFSYKP